MAAGYMRRAVRCYVGRMRAPSAPRLPGLRTPRPAARDGRTNPSFPFCSPACKLVDLGRWLDGSYRIPGPPESSLGRRDGETGDDE